MFMVTDWSGNKSEFNRKRFSLWLVNNLGLKKGHASYVNNELVKRFQSVETVSPQQLIEASSQIAISSLYNRIPIMPSVDPGTIITAAAEGAKFVAGLYKVGWTEEPGCGWVYEEGIWPDDSTAPRINRVTTSGKPTCCPDGQTKGVQLKITISVTDDGGAGNDTGVESVNLFGVDPKNGTKGVLSGDTQWKLSDSQQGHTEIGSQSHTFTTCIPCEFIVDGRATIWFEIVDEDGNRRIEKYTFPVNSISSDCCD
ncbi:MAG: hypothetical protein GY781_06580 [Gammaproteobacteria bacterium]|nr:hypothetical protein [Gammaproteobacteria bacterium]